MSDFESNTGKTKLMPCENCGSMQTVWHDCQRVKCTECIAVDLDDIDAQIIDDQLLSSGELEQQPTGGSD